MILDAKPEKRVVVLHIESNGDTFGPLTDVEVKEPREEYISPVDGKDVRQAAVSDVYTDHHVTCPKAADWRGRTRRTAPV